MDSSLREQSPKRRRNVCACLNCTVLFGLHAAHWLQRRDRVVQCIRVGGFVNATPEFLDYSKVINGASELFLTVFGDAGKHTRVSVGVNGLPYGVAVEVEAIFAVRD